MNVRLLLKDSNERLLLKENVQLIFFVFQQMCTPKVARVELRVGGGLYGPEKPGWSASGKEK